VVLALLGLALGGVDPPVAGAALRETPARRITRLRAKAARVHAAIGRMNTRIERLVGGYNEVREVLVTTKYQEQVVGADRAAEPAWPPSAAGSSLAWPPSGATSSA
jgi:hypothetical protein